MLSVSGNELTILLNCVEYEVRNMLWKSHKFFFFFCCFVSFSDLQKGDFVAGSSLCFIECKTVKQKEREKKKKKKKKREKQVNS